MFDNFKGSKIKNIKAQNWRWELYSYHFDIVFRPGPLNYAADALIWNSKTKTKYGMINSMSLEKNLLTKLHNCTPHERLFCFQRRPASIGNKILPSWLITPGTVLLEIMTDKTNTKTW